MGKTLGRFTIVLVAVAAILLGVSSASAQETTLEQSGAAPDSPTTVPADASTDPADAAGDVGADAPVSGEDPANAGDPVTLGAKPGAEAQSGVAAKAEHPSKLKLRLKGLKHGKLTAGDKINLAGTLQPFAAGEKVTVIVHRGKKTVKRKTLRIKRKNGKFSFQKRIVQSGRYSMQVIKNPTAKLGGTKDRTRTFKINYPNLSPGDRSNTVKLFNKLLEQQGYVNDGAKKYDSATGRAVLAFHKVNDKKRSENASASDFKKLAAGRGGFKLRYPGAGKHVETDLSRQVMVLARHGKAEEIYHISSGAPATPTILGHYQFYRKEPGTNSHGMVNSVYFIRGYATHGYADVPDYPASHGCLRNPIPDSLHIYNWIDIGDDIYVYP